MRGGLKRERGRGVCTQLTPAVLQFASGCTVVLPTAVAPSSNDINFWLHALVFQFSPSLPFLEKPARWR